MASAGNIKIEITEHILKNKILNYLSPHFYLDKKVMMDTLQKDTIECEVEIEEQH